MVPPPKISRRRWRGGELGRWTFVAAYATLGNCHSCEPPCFLGQFGMILVPGSGAGWRALWTGGVREKEN